MLHSKCCKTCMLSIAIEKHIMLNAFDMWLNTFGRFLEILCRFCVFIFGVSFHQVVCCWYGSVMRLVVLGIHMLSMGLSGHLHLSQYLCRSSHLYLLLSPLSFLIFFTFRTIPRSISKTGSSALRRSQLRPEQARWRTLWYFDFHLLVRVFIRFARKFYYLCSHSSNLVGLCIYNDCFTSALPYGHCHLGTAARAVLHGHCHLDTDQIDNQLKYLHIHQT